MKPYYTVAVVLLLAAFPLAAEASLLSWNNVTWPNGSLSQSYTVDGVGISMVFTGATNLLVGPGQGYPVQLPSDNWGPYYTWPVEPLSPLWFACDFASSSQSLILTMNFSVPVTSLTFKLYDLDGKALLPASYNVDQVVVNGFLGALSLDPSTVTYGSDITFISPNKLIGNLGDHNPGDPQNTATLQFGAAVNKMVLTFSPGPGSQTNPTAQGILLGDVSFVPEPATMLLLGLGGLFCRKFKKS